jgi:hypothetical protein
VCTRFLIPLLLLGCCLVTGCELEPVPPPRIRPMPNPVILKQEFNQNVFTSNEVIVELRNNGAAGIVDVNVYTLRDQGQMQRGESGIGESIRVTFTRDGAPPPVYVPDHKRFEYGHLDVHMKAGETTTVRVKVPAYNLTRTLMNESLHTEAKGRIQ